MFLAGEILAGVDCPDDLRVPQREALVPLELRLAADWAVPVTPAQLAQSVSAELERCNRRRGPTTSS